MSGVVISKSPSVLVAPAETVTGDISLSRYDKLLGHLPVTVLLVFDHAIQEPVETIKRGLSQALVHYYPMAGRFATGASSGEVVIKCTGEGVSFVAASANCAIEDVQPFSDPSLQQELAILFPETGGRYSDVDPLVLMQVTVFSCGGFVLGVTWSHAVADGIGIGQFVQAVGELARGLPSPSVVPVRQDDSLMLNPPPYSTTTFEFVGNFQLSQMAALDITVKPSLVNRIKDKYASMNSGRPCTVFEAVAAVLWRCRTRAIRSVPDALAVLSFSANERNHVGAKEGYYGNCIMTRLATASSGTVGNGDVMDLVKTVQRAKDGGAPNQSAVDELLQLDSYDILIMSSWRNLGLEAPDFGGGRPARVKCFFRSRETTMPSCIACIPCKDEYNVMSIFVKEDHAGAFLQELADMHLNYI